MSLTLLRSVTVTVKVTGLTANFTTRLLFRQPNRGSPSPPPLLTLPAYPPLNCSPSLVGGKFQLRAFAAAMSKISEVESRNNQPFISATMEELLWLLKEIVPDMGGTKHKGQAGKVAVVGGCREYTGAPYFAAISALKVGADLSHVFCSRDAAAVIKSYSPELIVHPVLHESYMCSSHNEKAVLEQSIAEVVKWLPRFDCLVVGPGLGRDELLLECAARIMMEARRLNIPLVVDGDGLFLVTQRPELVDGYSLAVLTPNMNEKNRLQEMVAAEAAEGGEGGSWVQLQQLSDKLGKVTVVEKGRTDRITTGTGGTGLECGVFGSPRRCGGQGDVLAGSVAVFIAWARNWAAAAAGEGGEAAGEKEDVRRRMRDNPSVIAAFAASLLLRRAAAAAFEKHKRSMTTTDIIHEIGPCFEELFPFND